MSSKKNVIHTGLMSCTIFALDIPSTAIFLKCCRLISDMNSNDAMLIDYVRRMINAGARKIVIPMYLMQHASHEALNEIRRLCTLNGLELEARG
jgi:hypothetical protein